MKYTVLIKKGDQFGYVVECPILNGCVSQGNTYNEAIDNVKEAIEAYIEALLIDGIAVPVEEGNEFVELDLCSK